MRRRRVIRIAVAALLLVVLLSFAFFRSDEPWYHGHSLTHWILRYSAWQREVTDNPAAHDDSETAIQQIGTNALPYLVKWLHYHETKAHENLVDGLRHLPGFMIANPVANWIAEDRNETRFVAAMVAFRALGPKADSSIPALTQMMYTTDRREDRCAREAIYALAGIGDTALPTLLEALNKPDFRFRKEIINSLGDEQMFAGNRAAAVPALLKCMTDPDEFIVLEATTSLGKIATNHETVVPALQKALENTNDWPAETIEALQKFGTNARPAVPQLLKSLSSTRYGEANAASNTLRQIAPEVLTNTATQ